MNPVTQNSINSKIAAKKPDIEQEPQHPKKNTIKLPGAQKQMLQFTPNTDEPEDEEKTERLTIKAYVEKGGLPVKGYSGNVAKTGGAMRHIWEKTDTAPDSPPCPVLLGTGKLNLGLTALKLGDNGKLPVSVYGRSSATSNGLIEQGGVYSVQTRGNQRGVHTTIMPNIVKVGAVDTLEGFNLLVHDMKKTGVVSPSVTASGYNCNPPEDGKVLADYMKNRGPALQECSLMAKLTMALYSRYKNDSDALPPVLMAMENAQDNSGFFKQQLLNIAEQAGDKDFVDYLRKAPVSNTMVDRIVSERNQKRSVNLNGKSCEDAVGITCEEYPGMIVAEKKKENAAAIDALNMKSVLVQEDIDAVKKAKMGLLNAMHTLMGIVGLLNDTAGDSIPDLLKQDEIKELYQALHIEIGNGMGKIPDVDLDKYRVEIAARLENEHLKDSIKDRLAKELNRKAHSYLIPTMKTILSNGGSVDTLCHVVAMGYESGLFAKCDEKSGTKRLATADDFIAEFDDKDRGTVREALEKGFAANSQNSPIRSVL